MIDTVMRQRGFTIVELLIVIVIISILAVIVIVAYSGIQDRARAAKIQTDEKALIKAIISARNTTGNTLLQITGNIWTADACYSQPSAVQILLHYLLAVLAGQHMPKH